MPRQQTLFKEGDVVAYEGKPMYVDRIVNDAGRKLVLYAIDANGKLTGHAKEVYEGWYADKLQLIDFAKVEITVKVPEEWQKTLVPPLTKDEKIPNLDDETPEAHPSYGVAVVTRPSAGSYKLFMSAMQHYHFISLQVYRAKKRRGLHEDTASQSEHLLEVRFSEAQWGRLLSSVGMGGGVPCTLSYIGGQQMPEVPEQDTSFKFHEEIKQDAVKAAEQIKETIKVVQALMDKPSVTKAERKTILDRLNGLYTHIVSNMPFILKQYDERMEKMVVDAKTEVEGFMLNMAKRLGQQALAEQAPKLLLGKGEEE